MVTLTARALPETREVLTLSGEPAVVLARRVTEMQHQFIVELRKPKADDEVAQHTRDKPREEDDRMKAVGGTQAAPDSAYDKSQQKAKKVQGLDIRV